MVQRRQRLERQDQRLLDAYQAEMMTLSELQPRRQKLAAEWQQIEQERRQLVHTRQQSVHWQQVIDNAATCRQLLGDNLEQLSFDEWQAIARCLMSKVVVTGEEVDIHFVLPFDSTPQMARHLPPESEGTPGHFYRLRLAHFQVPLVTGSGTPVPELIGILLAKLAAPLADGFVGYDHPTCKEQLFDVTVTQTKTAVQSDPMADNLGREAVVLVAVGR